MLPGRRARTDTLFVRPGEEEGSTWRTGPGASDEGTVAGVPEGHTIHRLARRHVKLFGGQPLRASSPQGRFADGAALIDGRTLEGTDAYGKHLFHRYGRDLFLHIHLGLYGKFTEGPLPATEPRGALRLRLQGEATYLDLRGPITCEVITRGEKDAVTAALGPDPLRPHADPALAQAKLAAAAPPSAPC